MFLAHLIVGALLLILGRRLFWLFVACVGFVVGYRYGPQFLTTPSELTVLLVAVGVGLLGAVLAVLFQHLAVAVAGFAAGGLLATHLCATLHYVPRGPDWLAYVVGGLFGAILLLAMFDWAVILLSSFVGAAIIMEWATFDPLINGILFLGMIAAGVLIQARQLHASGGD